MDTVINRLYNYDVTSIETMHTDYKNLYDKLINDQ